MAKSIQRMVLIVVSVIMLAACGMSNEKVVEKSKEAMDDAKSMKIEFNEKETNGVSTGTTYTMDKGEQFRIEYDNRDSVLYGDEDVILLQEGSYVRDLSADRDNFNVETIIELLVNPLEVFEDIDEDFLEHIEIEKEDEEITLKYIGDEDDEDALLDMGKAYLKVTLSDQENRDFDEIDVSKFSLTMKIDAETYLANKVHLKVTYEEQGIENEMNQKYTYEEYDEIEEIEKPELDSSENISDTNSPSEINSPEGTELDPDVVEGAGEYVEALIYATVYQDEKAFVSSAPSSMSENEAKEHAKLQKESFREIYKSNTKGNMAGLNVTEEQFDQLTDAFLDAISKGEFKVLTSTAKDSGNVVVTVSINGINNTKVYEETEKKLEEAIAANENMSQDDIVSKNLEILIAEYKNAEKIKEAVEVPVNVMVQNGQYKVLLQDEYLNGFVQ